MRTIAILQARLRSTRLPAKVLLDLAGKTVLQRCIERVARIQGVDEVIVATSTAPENDLIVGLVEKLGFRAARGDEKDVLSRYVDAARAAKADVVMRCTADCPLLDPAVSGSVLRAFLDSRGTATPFDYASNTLDRKMPRGLDTEVVSMAALERAHADATAPAEREHVTMHVYANEGKFRLHRVLPERGVDFSQHRWTIDTLEDYHFLWKVCAALGERASTASMHDVLELLQGRPELVRINENIHQKPVTA